MPRKRIKAKAGSRCGFLPLVLCALLFASCEDKPPVPEQKFADLYVRLQLLELQFAGQPAMEKLKDDSLLRALNLNNNVINAELSWYSKNPERWQHFFSDVQRRLGEIKNAYIQPKADAPLGQKQSR